jgi:carbon-monoxide dehydrogenase medium subunit
MYTMRPQAFDYHRPQSLDEALGLLASIEDARPLAGGHSLLPMMKVRLAVPAAIVDIGRLPGLDEIAFEGDSLTIGALATHAAVAASPIVREACPVIAETASTIGDFQVRNRGTIGGSIAHADPAADYPTVLKALGATITATGEKGEREISADDFFRDLFTTALERSELVTHVRIPATSASGLAAAYVKHRHPASSYAVVGAAAVVGANGTCTHARLAIGGATPSPLTVEQVAQALVGQEPSDDAIAGAAEAVAAAIAEPMADTYASGEYRTHLAFVTAKRALAAAFAQARSS